MFGLNSFGKIGALVRSAFAQVFSPLSLFANSEVGAWYDPSDLTTMFQDRYGSANPVTSDGQTVGLILDKSKGLAETATSIDGDMNTATWTKGTGWSSSGTRSITCDGTNGSSSDCSAPYTKPTGSLVRWSFNIVSISGTLNVYASSGVNTTYTTSGIKTVFSDSASSFNIFRANAGTTCTITDIKIEVIAGNHAVAPSDAARPLYKTDGTYHWLQFDGVDDSLRTAAINLTGTDKMSVFCGLRKSGATTWQQLVELSSNSDNNAGTFGINSPGGNVDGYALYLKGATGQTSAQITTGYAAPIKSVLSNLQNLAGATNNTSSSVRINSVLLSPTYGGSIPGGGTYGTWPLYLGSRGGVSARLNGNIYSIIIRGALSTAQEITDTETWVNSKTGAF